jgi:hypothetical protein
MEGRSAATTVFTPGPHVSHYLAALTIATMPALMAGGSPNQASMMTFRSASVWTRKDPSVTST